jgi:hypothetical protein
LASNTTVGEALRQYYSSAGLPPDGGADDEWFSIHIGPLAFRLPNPPARRRAVFFHDTNHLLTGYDTVFSNGEMLIAGYELGSGCGHYWFAWLINFMMFGLGLLLRPRKIYHAFLRGRRCLSLYERTESPRVLSEIPLAVLRVQMGINAQPAARRVSDSFAFSLWALAAIVPPVFAVAASTQWLISR